MTSTTTLEDHVILVTGASAGIGRTTAEVLAARGARLVVTARRAERLDALVEGIRSAGGRAEALAADVVDADAVRTVVDRTVETHGRIDVLVNNAGIMRLAPMAECAVEDWAAMVDVNVKGPLHFLGAVLPHMIERGSGHVIGVGSLAGRRPFPGGTVYSATKFAMRSLSWGMHLELGSAHGIRVTDIQPGFVSTELLEDQPDTREAWEDAWSGRRTLQPEDVARTIEFAITSPDHVTVSELLVRPTDQPT